MLERFFTPRMTELGKLKIGGKSAEVRRSKAGGEWRAPVKLDHFLITTMQRNPAGDLVQDTELMDQLAREHGDADGALRQIPIQVLSNDIEDVMQTRYVWYVGRTVGAKSDAETVTWYCNPNTGEVLDQPKTEPWKPEMLDYAKKGVKLFKTHSVFNCVIASKQARFGGVYKFRTTSVISGRQLYSSLLEVQARTFGVLMGLPLRLIVRPMQVTPEGKATTIYVVHAELHGPSLAQIQQQALDQMRVFAEHRDQMHLVQTQYKRLLLPPGEETSAIDAKDINEEFSPETVDAETEAPPEGDDPLLADTAVEPENPPDGEPEPATDAEAEAFIAEMESDDAQDAPPFDRAKAVDEITDFCEIDANWEAFVAACKGIGINPRAFEKSGDGPLEALLGKVRDLSAAKQ